MGYAISLNLIHEPETDDVDGLLEQPRSRARSTASSGPSRRSATTGPGRTRRSPDLPVPVMLVGGMAGQTSLPSIGIDNRAIGRLATEHLLAGGAAHGRHRHRAPRLVGGAGSARRAGARRSRRTAWRPRDALVVEGDWTANSGEEGLYRLLDQRAPTSTRSSPRNDQMALGVLHGAHRLGRRVPEDLSVVGVDNIAEASHFWPALTTVHQPLRDAGALAVREIDASIRPPAQHAPDPETPAAGGHPAATRADRPREQPGDQPGLAATAAVAASTESASTSTIHSRLMVGDHERRPEQDDVPVDAGSHSPVPG